MSEVSGQVWLRLQLSDSRLEAALPVAMLCAIDAGGGMVMFLGVQRREREQGWGAKFRHPGR